MKPDLPGVRRMLSGPEHRAAIFREPMLFGMRWSRWVLLIGAALLPVRALAQIAGTEFAPSLSAYVNSLSGMILSDLGVALMGFPISIVAGLVVMGWAAPGLVFRVTGGLGGVWLCAWTINRLTGPLETVATRPFAAPPLPVPLPPPPAPPAPELEAAVAGVPFWAILLLFAVAAGAWALVSMIETVSPGSVRRAKKEAVDAANLLVEVLHPDKVCAEVLAERPAENGPVERQPVPGAFDRAVALHHDRQEVAAAAMRIRTAYDEMRKLAPLGRRAQRLQRRLDQDVGTWLLELPPKRLFPVLTENMRGSLDANAEAAEALLRDLIAERVNEADIGAKVNRDRHAGGDLSI